MRDTRRRRIVLVVLILVSLTLIALGGGSSGPGQAIRDGAGAVFGPVERAVSAAFRPVRELFGGLSQDDQARIDQLQKENDELRLQARADEYANSRANELNDLLKVAGLGQYRVVPAQVISIGPRQSFSETALLDAGSNDGLKVDMTVINGQGLVGRVKSVTPTTATVLLAIDRYFTVGARQEKTLEVASVSGQGGGSPMLVRPFSQQATLTTGSRFVTSADATFPGGVPIGELVSVSGSVGSLTRTATLRPYVDFTSLDLVGVIVVAPRTDPRDSVLPPRPTPTPTPTAPTPTAPTPSPGATSSSVRSTG